MIVQNRSPVPYFRDETQKVTKGREGISVVILPALADGSRAANKLIYSNHLILSSLGVVPLNYKTTPLAHVAHDLIRRRHAIFTPVSTTACLRTYIRTWETRCSNFEKPFSTSNDYR